MASAYTLSAGEATYVPNAWTTTWPSAITGPSTFATEAAAHTGVRVVTGPGGPVPRAFEQGTLAVIDLLHLNEGWNSYRARQIEPAVAKRAIALLGQILGASTPAPAVVPRVRGGIQFEWHGSEVEIEIYISEQGVVDFYAGTVGGQGGGAPFEGPLSGNEPELLGWLGRLA